MSKYTNTTITGFNATPPSDDGTEVDSNKVKWQTHLDKLASPVKNLAESINTALISHFDIGPVAHAVNYTVLIADYGKTLESSGTITITMGTLAALGAGFIISIKNVGAGIITVDGASAETIDGNLTIALDPNESVLLQSDAGMSDWLILSRIDPVTRASLLIDTTDDVTFGGISAGSLGITHTATISNEHAVEIACDAAGFGDVRAVEIEYITGAISPLAEESSINININKTSSNSGSRVMGLNVNTTADGSAIVQAVRAGAQVDPINHSSGSFGSPTFASNNTTATDVAIMRDGNSGTTTSIMIADNDYIIIGAVAAFGSLTLNLTTFANQSINPTFFFSEAGTNTFGQFFPTDGTDGLKQSGVISWDPASLTDHAADTVTGTFNIKIVRTRNGLPTTPILGHAESAAITIYGWDKDALLTVDDIQLPSGGLMQARLNSIETVNTAQDVRLTDNEANIITNATDIMAPIPVVTVGTTSAYTATLGIASYVNNSVYELRMHLTCIDNPTLALDGLAALSIYILDGDFIRLAKSDDLLIGSIARFRYDGIRFVIVNTQDYQSTYNVTLSPSTSGSITLNSNFLAYVKRARLATVTGKITVLSVSSPVGFLVLPLPYPAAILSGDSDSGLVSVNFQTIGTAVDLGLYGEIAGSNIQIYEQLSTGQGLTVANKIAAGTILLFNFSYITA